MECKQIDEENGNESNYKTTDKNHSKKEVDENGQNKTSAVKNPPMLKRKFLRCSSLATVTHLKKFIAKKVNRSYYKNRPANHLFRMPISRGQLISFSFFFSYYLH